MIATDVHTQSRTGDGHDTFAQGPGSGRGCEGWSRTGDNISTFAQGPGPGRDFEGRSSLGKGQGNYTQPKMAM